MSAVDLAGIAPGFDDPVLASQAVFRRCLTALARPGTIVECGAAAATPAGLHAAAGALALALLDQDTRLWLSPALAAAGAYLRFHTGCRIADDPARADFALVASPAELPALEALPAGTDEDPDRSATIFLQLDGLSGARGWCLSGPGIRGAARLHASGLGDAFLAQWAANGARFPRGVDLFLVCGERLCGLPRTTRIEG